MTWWLVPSILVVVLIGIIVGLVVGQQVLKAQKNNILLVHRQKRLTDNGIALESVYRTSGLVESPSVEKRQTKRAPSATPPEDEELKGYLHARRESAIDTPPLSPALLELNLNLSIANRPLTNKLVNFLTDTWKNNRHEFDKIDAGLMEELTEVYVDMMLANNIVWLVNELGRDSQELKDSYANLSNQIAKRLQRIIDLLPASKQ